jgi:hypothetical protein
MASSCPSCREKIQEGAKVCKHCGARMKWGRNWIKCWIIAGICLLLGLAFPIFWLGTFIFFIVPFIITTPKEVD